MAAKDVIKNANLFLDGSNFAGQLDNVDPPKLTLLTEEFRAGGMNGAVELTTGHEPLRMSAEIINFSPQVFALFNVAEGTGITAMVRAALESWDGSVQPIKWTVRGKVVELDPQNVKPGTPARHKLTMALDYYKLTINDRDVIEIDVLNMTQIINGVDVMARVASALGIR